MADPSDSVLQNAFGTLDIKYGRLNPGVSSIQTPYDTNTVDEFSVVRGMMEDYINPQALQGVNEFWGIVTKVERSIQSCRDEGQLLSTIARENASRMKEECIPPGPRPVSNAELAMGDPVSAPTGPTGDQALEKWLEKSKKYEDCVERRGAPILFNTEIRNHVGYARVCIPELDPRPLPAQWPSEGRMILSAACKKDDGIAYAIAETYPVFEYGMNLVNQNYITPGALVLVRLTHKPAGPRGPTSAIPPVSEGGTILQVKMNENGRPIVLTKRATTASSALLPCGGRELAPPPDHAEELETEVTIEVTPENQEALDALDAGVPAADEPWRKWFIAPPGDSERSKQLTRDITLQDFRLSAWHLRRKSLPPNIGKLPQKYWDNVKILADNLQVLCDYLYDGDMRSGQLKVTSGYRPRAYNNKPPNKGAKHSQHIYGRAADIKFPGIPPRIVFLAITDLIARGRMRDGGLGYYSYSGGFVHYDVRPSGDVTQEKTTKEWTGSRGGPRWYQTSKSGKRKKGILDTLRVETVEIQTYVGSFGDDPDLLNQRTYFEDRYWLANPAVPGVDDAAAPAGAS